MICTGWNTGLQIAGFPLFTICVICQSISFLILALCLSESCSGRPFNGGSYAITRAVVGLNAGATIGLIEVLEYIIVGVTQLVLTSNLLQSIFNTDPSYNLAWDVGILVFSLVSNLIDGQVFWALILFYGGSCMIGMLVYLFGAWQFFDIYANSSEVVFTFGSFVSFAQAMPYALSMFNGVEGLSLCCEETHDAQENVPKGYVSGTVFMIILFVLTYFTVIATPQSDLFGSTFPMTDGYALAWGIDTNDYNTSLLLILAVVPMLPSACGFTFVYARQFLAMSRSGILPEFLSLTTESTGSPYGALLFGTGLSLFLCILIRQSSNGDDIFTVVNNTGLLLSLLNYLGQLSCYIVVRWKYAVIKHRFLSPLGIPGAVFALVVFITTLISLVGWTDLIGWCFVVVGAWLALGFFYQKIIAKGRVILSPEEKLATFMYHSARFSQMKMSNLQQKKYEVDK